MQVSGVAIYMDYKIQLYAIMIMDADAYKKSQIRTFYACIMK